MFDFFKRQGDSMALIDGQICLKGVSKMGAPQCGHHARRLWRQPPGEQGKPLRIRDISARVGAAIYTIRQWRCGRRYSGSRVDCQATICHCPPLLA